MEKILRNTFSYFLPDEKFYLEASKQHEHLMRSEEPTFSTLEQLFLKEEPLHEDPIEETCEETLIEDIVKDPHVFMEVSECPQDYFSEEDDHNKKPFQNHIVKLMMKYIMNITMIVWKVYYLVTFF